MRVDDISPGWVNRVVAGFGRYTLAPCADVVTEPIPNERVQVHRLLLRYSPGPGLRPESLILKTPVGPALPGGVRSGYDAGAREAYFFRHLAGSATMATPRCYAVDFDPLSNSSIILFEDLSIRGLRQGNRVSGIRQGEAQTIVRELAELHARYWARTQGPAFRELESLTQAVTTAADDAIRGYYQDAWPAVEACGLYEISPDVAQFGRSLLEDPNRAKHKLSERPQTILHGDVHVENIFFDDTVEPARVTLFDWEDVTIGNGLSDVAWLVTTSVGTGDVEWEAELVRHYYEALLAAGIEDYSWGECQADYRLAIENVFVQGVLNSCVERGESAEEIAAEHELGQRYMLAAHRGRIWEIRDSKGVAGQTAT